MSETGFTVAAAATGASSAAGGDGAASGTGTGNPPVSSPVKKLPDYEIQYVINSLGGYVTRVTFNGKKRGQFQFKNLPQNDAEKRKDSKSTSSPDDLEKGKDDPSKTPLAGHYRRVLPVPGGLYKKVIKSRKDAQWMYRVVATFYNSCIILQLILGATLTALGPSDNKRSTAITIIAAANTVTAGIIALMHNSGLPNRFRNDWNEFLKVELFMMELMQSGAVNEGQTGEQAVQTCKDMYNAVITTVENNKPASYVPTVAAKAGAP